MTSDDMLRNAIDESDAVHVVYIDNKADLIEHFKDKYGEKKWKREATAFVAGTRDSKSLAYKSAIRNFQGKRLDQPGETKKWKEEGEKLPPIRRELAAGHSSITITVRGDMKQGPKGGTEPLSPVATFSGPDAYAFINDPSYEDIYDGYDMDPDLLMDGDYELEVGSVSAA